MAHLQIEQRLETLGGQSIFHVVLPEAGDLDLHTAPVIYLLHGAGDNGTGWLRYTAAERQELIQKYTKEMKAAAKLLEFEHAAYLRDKISKLQGNNKLKGRK